MPTGFGFMRLLPHLLYVWLYHVQGNQKQAAQHEGRGASRAYGGDDLGASIADHFKFLSKDHYGAEVIHVGERGACAN